MAPKAVIFAEVHSDDYRAAAKFDAEDWFKQATEQQIRDLVFCEWGGDYAADEVAKFYEESNPLVKKVFDYLACVPTMPYSRDTVGFECHVDPKTAAAWLKANRQDLYAALISEGVLDSDSE